MLSLRGDIDSSSVYMSDLYTSITSILCFLLTLLSHCFSLYLFPPPLLPSLPHWLPPTPYASLPSFLPPSTSSSLPPSLVHLHPSLPPSTPPPPSLPPFLPPSLPSPSLRSCLNIALTVFVCIYLFIYSSTSLCLSFYFPISICNISLARSPLLHYFSPRVPSPPCHQCHYTSACVSRWLWRRRWSTRSLSSARAGRRAVRSAPCSATACSVTSCRSATSVSRWHTRTQWRNRRRPPDARTTQWSQQWRHTVVRVGNGPRARRRDRRAVSVSKCRDTRPRANDAGLLPVTLNLAAEMAGL